jgi:hypothetical protein
VAAGAVDSMRCRAYLQFDREKLNNVRRRVAQVSDEVLSRLGVSTRFVNLADVAGATMLVAIPLRHQVAYEITDLELLPCLELPASYRWFRRWGLGN